MCHEFWVAKCCKKHVASNSVLVYFLPKKIDQQKCEVKSKSWPKKLGQQKCDGFSWPNNFGQQKCDGFSWPNNFGQQKCDEIFKNPITKSDKNLAKIFWPSKTNHNPRDHLYLQNVMGFSKIPSQSVGL